MLLGLFYSTNYFFVGFWCFLVVFGGFWWFLLVSGSVFLLKAVFDSLPEKPIAQHCGRSSRVLGFLRFAELRLLVSSSR